MKLKELPDYIENLVNDVASMIGEIELETAIAFVFCIIAVGGAVIEWFNNR